RSGSDAVGTAAIFASMVRDLLPNSRSLAAISGTLFSRSARETELAHCCSCDFNDPPASNSITNRFAIESLRCRVPFAEKTWRSEGASVGSTLPARCCVRSGMIDSHDRRRRVPLWEPQGGLTERMYGTRSLIPYVHAVAVAPLGSGH